MQQVETVVLKNSRTHISSSAVALTFLAIAFVMPVRVSSYDFRHFTTDQGMTISFSKSAPPLAALEDEHLPVIKTEPVQFMKVDSKSKIIASGNQVAWKRLQKYANYFEKKHYSFVASRTPLKVKYTQKIALAPFAKKRDFKKNIQPRVGAVSLAAAAAPVPGTAQRIRVLRERPYEFRSKLGKVSELTKLLTPVSQPTDFIPRKISPELPTMAATQESARGSGLKVTQSQATAHVKSSLEIPIDAELSASTERLAEGGSLPSLIEQTPPPRGFWQMRQDPTASNSNSGRNNPPARDPLSVQAAKTLGDGEGNQEGSRIAGQVELTGGLAVTGQSTQLSIQWKASGQTVDAQIDYSTGQFIVDVPNLDGGKLVARLYDDTRRVLGEAFYDIDGVASPGQKILEGVKLIIDPKETSVRGKVLSAYSVDDIIIPAKDVAIFGPAGTRDQADAHGAFRLSGLNSDSSFVLEAYAPDHWGTRIISEGNRKTQFPVFPAKMLQSFFDLVDQSANNTEVGVIWGTALKRGKPQAGVSVTLASADAIGPFYFNGLRIPDRNLKATTSNGLYAFIKVRPGLHLLMAKMGTRELPSAVASVSASMVSYTEIGFKSAHLKGRTQDPISQTPVEAQISVVGASGVGATRKGTFDFQIPSSDPVLFIEANAGPEYFVSREALSRSALSKIDLLMYKKDWLQAELQSAGLRQVQDSGIMLGYITGPGFHVSVDPDSVTGPMYSDQNIGYFGKDGHLENGRIEGLQGGGGFVLTNLPAGLHTLVITSSEGEMVSSRLFVSEPGILNVTNFSLRP